MCVSYVGATCHFLARVSEGDLPLATMNTLAMFRYDKDDMCYYRIQGRPCMLIQCDGCFDVGKVLTGVRDDTQLPLQKLQAGTHRVRFTEQRQVMLECLLKTNQGTKHVPKIVLLWHATAPYAWVLHL